MHNELTLCVLNNAEWCDAVATAHGTPGAFTPAIWTQPKKAPPYYSNAITLLPSHHETQRAAIARLIPALPDGFSVKDSFDRLDLSGLRFLPLVDAEWVWLDPSAAPKNPPAKTPRWQRVTAKADLAHWEAAWRAQNPEAIFQVFPPSLLKDERIAFLGRKHEGNFVAGCIANCSSGHVVGFSNFFATGSERDALCAAAIAEVARFAPKKPIVGYDREAELAALLALGFRGIGKLKVWLRQ